MLCQSLFNMDTVQPAMPRTAVVASIRHVCGAQIPAAPAIHATQHSQSGRQAGIAPVVLCASAYLRFVKLCAELSFLSLQGLLLCLQARAAGCQLYVVVYAALHGG
jgi:hypothetical protein